MNSKSALVNKKSKGSFLFRIVLLFELMGISIWQMTVAELVESIYRICILIVKVFIFLTRREFPVGLLKQAFQYVSFLFALTILKGRTIRSKRLHQ